MIIHSFIDTYESSRTINTSTPPPFPSLSSSPPFPLPLYLLTRMSLPVSLNSRSFASLSLNTINGRSFRFHLFNIGSFRLRHRFSALLALLGNVVTVFLHSLRLLFFRGALL
jgi:hypothetical protein